MWLWNNIRGCFFHLFFGFSTIAFLQAQSCELKLKGEIIDAHTQTPIEGASISLEGGVYVATSDTKGRFLIERICPGTYHLTVVHIGCDALRLLVTINQDTALETIRLDHHHHSLDAIEMTGHRSHAVTTQATSSLNASDIFEQSTSNLSSMLSSLPGVNAVKSGSEIAKPVVHGLYGNRLTILNHGIPQSGQQWGNDHSPEIDPLIAERISVVKGVSTVAYQGNTLGGLIIVYPAAIDHEPHLHGHASYFFSSNGLKHGLHAQLQQYTDALGWKVAGTIKKGGDQSAPTYYLRNTGSEEYNLAVQLEKPLTNKWLARLYLSTFNTTLGVLRGAHISNLTDLNSAFLRKTPFFTEKNFLYRLDAPRQTVSHYLIKAAMRYDLNANQSIRVVYALQLNLRKEFDIRRGNRMDMPALSLNQSSHFFEGKYAIQLEGNMAFQAGSQLSIKRNSNLPETGILPLIPDYVSNKMGAFVSFTKSFPTFSLELGSRYDYFEQRVAAISTTLPRRVERYLNQFHNFSSLVGIRYEPFSFLHIGYNIGYASRSPAINELYSNGLHQGVSGIEEGNTALKQETSIKTTLSLEMRLKETLFFEALFYYHLIDDYIYLAPIQEIRLTIRGAFPVFHYEQSLSRLYGLDASATYNPTKRIQLNVQYSYLRGDNIGEGVPLVNMPANTLRGKISYQIPRIGKMEHIILEVHSRYVFKQTYLEAEQDFVPPPPAYYLLGAKLSMQRQVKINRLNMYVNISNLLNVRYRDYLNRQHYFSDDVGLTVTAGVQFSF